MKKEKKVKILILTQKVDQNDDVLGFFHGWVKEFAKHCEQVTVIALGVGEYDLPQNVRVFSLGKELRKRSDLKNSGPRSFLEEHFRKIKYLLNFYRLIWRERKNYDVVFVHMNPIYVVLGALFWKIWGKKVGLWYTHKNVDMKLRIAEKLSNIIFTASRESFRLISKKVVVVGHGIDVLKFLPTVRPDNDIYIIISIGRFSPTKKQYDMVTAFKILRERGFNGQLVLVGGPITNVDVAYKKKVEEYIKVKNLAGHVLCVGPVSPNEASLWYKKADMFINLSATGSMDKAVLEAMAFGLQVVTSNEAFKDILPPDNFIDEGENLIEDIVSKVMFLSGRAVNPEMREYVAKNHNISVLIPRIVWIIKQQ